MGQTLRNTPADQAYFVGPHGLDTRAFESLWPSVAFVPFERSAFASQMSYSNWMLRPELYRHFLDYDFVLIAQTDAFLIEPLPIGIDWGFDYVGAPWEPPWIKRWDSVENRVRSANRFRGKRLRVGNGGLSLRRTSTFAEGLNFPDPLERTYEDIAISFFHRRIGVKLAPVRIARRFFAEMGARRWTPGDAVPEVYGFHALDKFNPRLEDLLLYGTASVTLPSASS